MTWTLYRRRKRQHVVQCKTWHNTLHNGQDHLHLRHITTYRTVPLLWLWDIVPSQHVMSAASLTVFHRCLWSHLFGCCFPPQPLVNQCWRSCHFGHVNLSFYLLASVHRARKSHNSPQLCGCCRRYLCSLQRPRAYVFCMLCLHPTCAQSCHYGDTVSQKARRKLFTLWLCQIRTSQC